MEKRIKNHYLSCVYLKRWATPEGHLWAYRILVSHRNVRPWKQTSPGAVAYRPYLYTQNIGGNETDEFERWLDSEFETPAQEPLIKATTDARLTPDDWERLIRFTAAQDLRTPARLGEEMKRWQETLPNLLEKTLKNSVRKLAEEKQPLSPAVYVSDAGLPLRIAVKHRPEQKKSEISAEIAIGRGLWLWSMKHVLEGVARILHQHKWTIVRPPKGQSWLTSDSPVLRLNFSSISDYNFRGGWGSQGTEIVFPLGPQHLLYTQVGKRPILPRGQRMSAAAAELFRRMIAEHAHRFIFATEPYAEVARLRPHIVDADLFRHEREQWAVWNEHQATAERQMTDTRAGACDND